MHNLACRPLPFHRILTLVVRISFSIIPRAPTSQTSRLAIPSQDDLGSSEALSNTLYVDAPRKEGNDYPPPGLPTL